MASPPEYAALGTMLCPPEMRHDLADAVQNATAQLTLSVAVHATVRSAAQRVSAAVLVQVRDALARRYLVLQRRAQVFDAAPGTHWLFKSTHGVSVRWSAPEPHALLHDVELVVGDADATRWQRLTQSAMNAGFPLSDRSDASLLAAHERPPWRLLACVCGDRVDVSLVFNHAVADGTSSLRLSRDVCAALDCALGDADFAALWPGPPVGIPPTLGEMMFGGSQPDLSWWERGLLTLLGAAMWAAPSLVLKPDIPNVAIVGPFQSAVAWSEPCSKAEWSNLFAQLKANGVRLQAALDAVALFLTGSVIAARNGAAGTSKPIKLDIVTPVTLRSAARVPAGRPHCSDEHVGLTLGFASVEAHVEAGDTFWTLCKRLQLAVEKATRPADTRFSSLVFSFLMTMASADASMAAVLASFDPINLGAHVSSCQFERVSATHIHLGQKSIPLVAPAFGYLWPLELNGQASFTLEYEARTWTAAQANELLALFTTTLFNPPSETFAQFATRMHDPTAREHILSRLPHT